MFVSLVGEVLGEVGKCLLFVLGEVGVGVGFGGVDMCGVLVGWV